MALHKPYHRIHRPMINGDGEWDYLHDSEYAVKPDHYTRAFLIIQKDIKNLFEYIEPADQNLKTFSFEIYQLLLRTATEIEANFKAILNENNHIIKQNKYTINVYKKINVSHHLDAYSAEFPIWTGEKKIFKPFGPWKEGKRLIWYDAYNLCKHDRVKNLHLANFENLLNAFCGLFILLTAQFGRYSYEPGPTLLSLGAEDSYLKRDFGIGDYLIIHSPDNWDENDYYDFNWNDLKERDDRFENFNYDAIENQS